jgi:16S rRNA (cytidine1402-2'-O)-methyltransferase
MTPFGTLYLVATPIGNLEDISQRALRILNEVDLIAAEDTRHTLKLLTHFEIRKPLVSYHQHNERERSQAIIERIEAGASVALVSDAGMPGISDPGNQVVADAIQRGIRVVPIPGPSAIITALAASGLDTGSFQFVGFLPRQNKEQLKRLGELKPFQGTLGFYEAPHRLPHTLKNIAEVLGERRVVLARELTKVHEEFIRGTLSEVIQKITEKEVRGEFTILVEGGTDVDVFRQNSTNNYDFNYLFDTLDATDRSLKEKLKEIAGATGRSAKEIYGMYLDYRAKK